MIGVVGVIAFITVLSLSLIVTRIATIALTYTGLSFEAARFQARSAFTGTGFTTSEAEKVVDHPVRRRIIMMLMIARSAGLVTIVISLILSFAGNAEFSRLVRLGWVVGGTCLLWFLSRSRQLDRLMSSVIRKALKRWTRLDTRDYADLLNIHASYMVTEILVREGDWLSGKALRQARLPAEGVTVLGIYRHNGDYVGVPNKDTEIYPGDTLVLYGRADAIRQLTERQNDPSGQRQHEAAVDEQRRHAEKQESREERHKKEHAAAGD
jgi:hypothetical protein